MKAVTVQYHQESEGWWAETEVLPTYSAAGASYEEVRDLVRKSLPEVLGERVELYEDLSDAGIDVPAVVHAAQPAWGSWSTLNCAEWTTEGASSEERQLVLN